MTIYYRNLYTKAIYIGLGGAIFSAHEMKKKVLVRFKFIMR